MGHGCWVQPRLDRSVAELNERHIFGELRSLPLSIGRPPVGPVGDVGHGGSLSIFEGPIRRRRADLGVTTGGDRQQRDRRVDEETNDHEEQYTRSGALPDTMSPARQVAEAPRRVLPRHLGGTHMTNQLTPDTRALILDIEGTTTSIAFVYDTLFPFARAHMAM